MAVLADCYFLSKKLSWQRHVHIVFFLEFFMGSHYSKSLKYGANDKPGCMSGPFYSAKIMLKT